ncbi:MAG: pantoate kinase [Methanomicrobiales archaeon]|nr:pantoate kinase [Methanomicrobiales archaeon]
MAKVAVAFSPGHISGYFRRIEGDRMESTGSMGAGVVITEGVRSLVRASERRGVEIRVLDGERMSVTHGSPPLEYAMERLGVHARITTECRLPIGAGFGLSAASLLSSITAISALFSLDLSQEEIACLAHESELVHRTGLGDVAACTGGGLACRRGAGIHATIDRCFPDETIHALSLGPIPTREILSSEERMRRIGEAYPGRCPRDLYDFVALSRGFAERSGLLTPDLRHILARCDECGIPASMTMLGEGIFALGGDAGTFLAEFGSCWHLRIAKEGFGAAEVQDDP